jgi:hypothetical protein
MMYEIQSKNDFQAGATLIVRIPEEDVDKKALYTILADRPDFVLPFRHRAIDSQIEFTYQIGNRSKLSYLSGNRSPGEYAQLWFGILQPLLDCRDWFMTQYSFVLKTEYLYCDKNDKSISFIYIPSLKAYSDFSLLKSMATEIAKQNHVRDINLENKVVWAIQDFNPTEFLAMLKPYKVMAMPGVSLQNMPAMPATPLLDSKYQSAKLEQIEPKQPTVEPKRSIAIPVSEKQSVVSKPPASVPKHSDDIVIKIPSDGKAPKEKKHNSGFFGSKKEKETKYRPEKKNKSGLWGKKKSPQQEIIQGAAALPKQPEPARGQPASPIISSPPPPAYFNVDVTQLDVHETDAPKFRYIGNGEHPKVIEINVAGGGIYTIGRFDVSVGIKQSDFEFDKMTKAVSRRQAAIERSADGYVIVDLNSSAGTFINGQKIPPNTPFKLERGCQVSFGHSGANYIWEEW